MMSSTFKRTEGVLQYNGPISVNDNDGLYSDTKSNAQVHSSSTHFGTYQKSVKLRLVFRSNDEGVQELRNVQFLALSIAVINGVVRHMSIRHDFSRDGHQLDIQVLNGYEPSLDKKDKTQETIHELTIQNLEKPHFKIIEPTLLIDMLELQGKFSRRFRP
jgi:hypothetical protein